MVVTYEALLGSLPLLYGWVYVLLLCFTFFIMGAALQAKAGLLRLEFLRWILVALALAASKDALPDTIVNWSLVYLVVSAVLMVFALRNASMQTPAVNDNSFEDQMVGPA
jgi:hypothetical protein